MKRSVIDKIGMIKKEMFIWGDEKEYMARAVHNGIGLILFLLPSIIILKRKVKRKHNPVCIKISNFGETPENVTLLLS